MTIRSETPALRAVTRPLLTPPPLADLLTHAHPTEPLLWIRGRHGYVGIGETLRLSFTGADRFAEAARRWREIAAAARAEDPIARPGSGLVAFGSFAFSRHSSAESVLIVPSIVIGIDEAGAWVTEITRIDAERETGRDPAPVLAPEHFAAWEGQVFSDREDERHAYSAGVRDATRRIAGGDVQKIVLARRMETSIPADADLRVPLLRLAEAYDDCYTFAVDGMIGASPETLVKVEDGDVSARVLAGTRKRSLDASRDAHMRDELLSSRKEQQEHLFAVDSVVAAMRPHVERLTWSPAPFALQLPNVWHLATDVAARLTGDTSALELVGALHPTAAVAGTPTPAAVTAIDAIEPFDRGRYAGAVGWIDGSGDGDWAIALRSAQVEDTGDDGRRRVTAYAGGGIVEGSDADRELIETVAKFRPIIEAFSAAAEPQ